jgi:hypothetical protein
MTRHPALAVRCNAPRILLLLTALVSVFLGATSPGICGTSVPTLTFTLTPKVTPLISSEVFLSGVITNPADPNALPTPPDVLVNYIQFALSGASATFLTPDPNPFFANVPGVFSPGDVYSGIVFGVQFAPNTPFGSYGGTVTLLGDPNGADPGATESLGTATFQLTVAPEPGASSLGLAAIPLALVALRRRRSV